ncbi:MAG: ABC transporter substrate-binding protein [Lachnospiraceae bacterium]|nr:ABC transporter substrate-binding protein [Lachnospiraceae bacterium]
MKKKFISVMLMTTMVAALATGCGNSASAASTVDLNSMSVDEIAAKAKEEGKVESVGMPDTWANWGETWQGITNTYGLAHTDTDMSSAEEISLFKTEGKDATKDIGDVGQAFGPVAEKEGVTLKYKTSNWDSIPDWAKDDDGDWIIGYYGTMSIIVNNKIVKEAPTSFEDILNGDYKVAVGDVASATQAQYAVLAAAIAYGGDESDIQPGLDYFKKIAEQGRLDLGEFTQARIEKGEVGIAFLWDYNALGYREQFVQNNAAADFTVCIPSEASIQSGYCTILNAYSKRPYSAAMAREYILSDQGQINLAKGYAKPVRDVTLPEEVASKLLDDSQYANARMVADQDAWDTTAKTIGSLWQEDVIAYAK